MKTSCKNPLICDTCKGKHPTILHFEPRPLKEETSLTDKTSIFCGQTGAGDDCAMAIIPVRVRLTDRIKSIETYAFFDSGSSVSFCSESLLNELGGHGKEKRMTLNTMGVPFTMNTSAVNGLQVCDLDEQNVVNLPCVYTKDKMPVTQHHIPTDKDIQDWPHLSDIKFPKLNVEIGIMIGNNVPDAFTPFEIRTEAQGSPHATKTILGWIIWNLIRPHSGTSNQMSATAIVNRAQVMAIEYLTYLDQTLRASINQDFPERMKDEKRENSVEDVKFLDQCEKSVRMINGHYCMDLPFKDPDVQLPNNHSQGLQRLTSLKRKCLKNTECKDDYIDFMEKIIEKGYAEKIPENEINTNDGHVWYIPHHGIYHPKKPGKIRVVFDCTASVQGVSLNSQLLQGPDLTNSLLGVMLRFRQGKIGVMGDIESMFYQVLVSEKNRDSLRFIWWSGGNLALEPAHYRMRVHLFGAVSSPSCSNVALQQTVKDYGKQFAPSITDTVKKNMYVDDCLASADTITEAKELIKGASDLCSKGGFRLRKWISSSIDVVQTIPESERAEDIKQLDLECGDLPNERALGVYWYVESDSFGFQIQIKDKPVTRRGILSVTSSIYDPIGLASPFVLKAKIILQDLCRQNLDWDEPIPQENAKKWQDWIEDLPNIEKIRIPRSYKPQDFGKIVSCQLHTFGDASEQGYGMVSYLRFVDENNRVHCSFVMSKARVAPLKKITIPRMELTAASIAVKISNIIVKELDFTIDCSVFWTDSMSTLRCICNETSRFQTFVANRVAVIRDSTEVNQWRFVESKQNPADQVSRGVSGSRLSADAKWLNGPQFLWSDEDKWPKIPQVSDNLVADLDVKPTVNMFLTEAPAMERLFNYTNDWTKLKKLVAWMLVAIENLKRRVTQRKNIKMKLELTENDPSKLEEKLKLEMSKTRVYDVHQELKTTHLDPESIEKAETFIVKHIQKQHYTTELKQLNEDSLVRSSKLLKLDPFVKEGIIRVGGRLERANLNYDAKHPILLPKESHISRMIVEDIHKKVGHLGKTAILAVLRKKYWIIGASALIKGIIHRCVICRRYQSRSAQQKMANLPHERLIPDDPPFTRTGMDYFGPFEIRKGRTVLKLYGVIFTCMSTRAVHLEVAHSLDTDSCIHAIRRFIARRGQVRYIISDNGTNLVGAKRQLRSEIEKWNVAHINDFCTQGGIDWRFNPPAASHFGGFWERLIRIVRKVLHSVMHEQIIHFDDEGLQTIFCEVESIINGRPLTEMPNSPNENEVLTPNHLLLLQPGETFPPGTFSKRDLYSKGGSRWLQIQYLANIFGSRWINEYLPLLQERQKWLAPKRNVKLGDIVLVTENSPRNSWCLGRVVEIFKDKHDLVRSVRVKTKSVELIRPIAKLCLILKGDLDNSPEDVVSE